MKAEKMTSKESTVSRLPRCIVSILFTGVIFTGGFIFFVAFNSGVPEVATAKMVFGLIVLWVVLGGTLMYHFREQVRQCIQRLPVDWRVKFVLFATLLALMEEAIAVLMTNSAPFLGVKVGEAYITASTNFRSPATRSILFSPIACCSMFVHRKIAAATLKLWQSMTF